LQFQDSPGTSFNSQPITNTLPNSQKHFDHWHVTPHACLAALVDFLRDSIILAELKALQDSSSTTTNMPVVKGGVWTNIEDEILKASGMVI
jgi:hypothetical protein